MLYEILCEQFKCNDKPRGIIRFNETLNVVKGHDSGTNSIGNPLSYWPLISPLAEILMPKIKV